jgi:Domain of unknown function (DUF5666)
MHIRRRITGPWIALTLLFPLVLASCGGGLGTTAGGGTGGTGIGPVTGFGSFIVNGVRYDDAGIDNTSFFDDHGRDKSDLLTGMMVAVFGSIDGASGRADNIAILRHVDGPMDDNGVDLATNRLKVMGQDVLVDLSTVFDNGITSLADLRNLQGANVRHPELEVQGCADNNGVIHATFIHQWADDRLTGRAVQVRGTVSGLNTAAGTFFIGRKAVDYIAPGSIPAGVGNGSFVEAKGTLRPLDNVLDATSVKLEDATGGQPSGSRTEVEGYIHRVLAPNASFELLGPNGIQTVTWTTGTTSFRDGTPAEVRVGVKVEVEGVRKADQTLAATKIEIRRASNIKFETTVTNPQPSSLTLFGVQVKVNALTQYEDDSSIHLKTFGQANILPGDSLEVSAFIDNTTVPASIVATRVERVDAIPVDQHTLQGPVGNATANPMLILLGVTVTTTATGTTFLQADETPFPGATPVDQQNAFFDALTQGQTIVKARGQFASGGILANEVEIEPANDD